MKYTIAIKGKKVQLPDYTLEVVDLFDDIEKTNLASTNIREKVGNLYRFFEKLIGKEKVNELLGTLEKVDPNEVNILYLEIVNAYNTPLEQYQKKQLEKNFDREEIKQLTEFVKVLSDSNIDFQNGVPFKKKAETT